MGVVASTIDMSSLVHKESPCSLIPRGQPTMGVVINLNQDGLDNGDMGFAKALYHLIFCKKRLLVILVTILKINSLS